MVDLRAVLRDELKAQGIDAFVYEAAVGAQPDDPQQVSLDEVTRTDIFALVIGDSYGEVTEREYDRARELNKPCLVYERLGERRADPELERFRATPELSMSRGASTYRLMGASMQMTPNAATSVIASPFSAVAKGAPAARRRRSSAVGLTT